ncbi:MAG: Butyryl-CoA dehydrogenase [Candidatus Ozemobacter sibiricus]|jgi:alkylation response protein AidB-like acyl-CoA dehydrogenase|uniref:Butyryl-CoA dehydrogenase n=1 Tax=Candidatus Ozemobacter sibiricus TaxID=2268124 RepID=A0A367ZVK8_9BACT|nr:MAG: Butyryl-CoA dehydrogenase [Candidatus Ozemobacter sibiricus]
MIDFKLTPEQELIRKTVAEFAATVIAPVAAELDEKQEFSMELTRALARQGYLGIIIPPEYGGAGANTLTYCQVIEEVSKACAAQGVTMSLSNSLVAYPIMTYGSEEIKRKYLPALASGEKLGCFGLTEPNAGSDSSNQETTAVDDGDAWVINGSKIFISNGGVADFAVIIASTNRAAKIRGLSAFIVDKGTPGFSVGVKENKLGIRASNTAELVFQNCRIPKENILATPGRGFRIAMDTLDGGRIGVGAQACGIARAAYEAACKYAKERKQFGSALIDFQGIAHKLADMRLEIETTRLLTWKAAWLKDNKKRFAKDAAMAKLYGSEMATRVAHQAIQIHGGYGFIKDYPVERYYRDARILELYEGTSEVQRMVIASYVLGV